MVLFLDLSEAVPVDVLLIVVEKKQDKGHLTTGVLLVGHTDTNREGSVPIDDLLFEIE